MILFDYNFYINYYDDLKDYNWLDACNHFLNNGINEKRIFNKNLINYNNNLKDLNWLKECFNYLKNDIVNENLENKKNNLINILVRNCYRPLYFNIHFNSILTQTYKNYNLIYCYDNDNCLEYLNNYKNNINILFKAKYVDNSQDCFYNLYCNELLQFVKEGFVIFLDDDDMLTNKYVLENINKYLFNEDNLIFWKFKLSNKIIAPNIYNLQENNIASSSYCFHSKFKNLSKWELKYTGDFQFINNLSKKYNFNKIFIDKILVNSINNNLDYVGNYGKIEKKI